MSLKPLAQGMQYVMELGNLAFFLPYFLYYVFVRSTLSGYTPLQRIELRSTVPGSFRYKKSADIGSLGFSIIH